MSANITHTMLAGAALRALRQWLFELGHENPTIGSAVGGLPEVYHLLDIARVVHVRSAIAPSHPECLSEREVRALRESARRLGAGAWEARVIVRPNFHPSAILWRHVDAAVARPLAAGSGWHRPCTVLLPG
jgi:hypothetical protein